MYTYSCIKVSPLGQTWHRHVWSGSKKKQFLFSIFSSLYTLNKVWSSVINYIKYLIIFIGAKQLASIKLAKVLQKFNKVHMHIYLCMYSSSQKFSCIFSDLFPCWWPCLLPFYGYTQKSSIFISSINSALLAGQLSTPSI